MSNLFVVSEIDNVGTCLEDFFKYALKDIKNGESIIKYGFKIGVAITNIKKGERVHTHNMVTGLSKIDIYPPFTTKIICERRWSVGGSIRM